MSWLLIDIAALIEQSNNQKAEETGAANVGGAGMGGVTTSANVGPYPKPFAGMLRRASFPFDQKTALDYAYGRKKRRKK